MAVDKCTCSLEVLPDDVAYVPSVHSLFHVGSQVIVDIDLPGNNVFNVVDRYIDNRIVTKVLGKICLRSSVGHAVPERFDEFSQKNGGTSFTAGEDTVDIVRK
jgi:hypothetical protein